MTDHLTVLGCLPGVTKLVQREDPVVYFLVLGTQVVYVGQTVNLASRLLGHADKVYDSVFYIRCRMEERLAREAEYISFFNPPLNQTHRTGRRAESVTALPDVDPEV